MHPLVHPPTAAPHGWAVTIFTCWQSLRGAVGRDSGAPAEKLEPGSLRDPRRETAPSLTHTHTHKWGPRGIAWRVSAWFMAKMMLSPQRRAYFCMSYLMVMMSQYKRIFVFPSKSSVLGGCLRVRGQLSKLSGSWRPVGVIIKK